MIFFALNYFFALKLASRIDLNNNKIKKRTWFFEWFLLNDSNCTHTTFLHKEKSFFCSRSQLTESFRFECFVLEKLVNCLAGSFVLFPVNAYCDPGAVRFCLFLHAHSYDCSRRLLELKKINKARPSTTETSFPKKTFFCCPKQFFFFFFRVWNVLQWLQQTHRIALFNFSQDLLLCLAL